MKTYEVKRYLILIVGIIIIGLGIAVFVKANLGIDPFTLMNKGISKAIGIDFTILQWSISIGILVVVFFIEKKKIFVGTILNMLLVAPLIELFGMILERCTGTVESLLGNILIVIVGCIILCLGAGMYLGTNLGFAPYDLIAIMIAERKPIPFRWMRIITDAICVLTGWLCGAVVGIGTLIAVFGMGPLIDFFKKKTEKYLETIKIK